jgi:DNA repair photolyase
LFPPLGGALAQPTQAVAPVSVDAATTAVATTDGDDQVHGAPPVDTFTGGAEPSEAAVPPGGNVESVELTTDNSTFPPIPREGVAPTSINADQGQDWSSIPLVNCYPANSLVGQFVSYAQKQIETAKILILAAVLPLLSILLGRRVYVCWGDQFIYPNPMVSLIAPSGARKTQIINVVLWFINHLVPESLLADTTSHERLVESLAEQPERVMIFPEGNGLMDLVNRSPDLTTDFIRLADCNSISTDFKSNRHKSDDGTTTCRVTAKNPFFTVLFGIVPEGMRISNKNLTNGFLGRFMIFFATQTDHDILIPPPSMDTERKQLLDEFAKLKTLHGEMHLSNQAQAAFVVINADNRERLRKNPPEVIASNLNRLPFMIIKVAMLYQIAIDRNLEITLEALRFAQNLVELQHIHYCRFTGLLQRDKAARLQNRILSTLERFGGHMTWSKLHNRVSTHGECDATTFRAALEMLAARDLITLRPNPDAENPDVELKKETDGTTEAPAPTTAPTGPGNNLAVPKATAEAQCTGNSTVTVAGTATSDASQASSESEPPATGTAMPIEAETETPQKSAETVCGKKMLTIGTARLKKIVAAVAFPTATDMTTRQPTELQTALQPTGNSLNDFRHDAGINQNGNQPTSCKTCTPCTEPTASTTELADKNAIPPAHYRMNGKPVYEVEAKAVVNFKSGFRHKLLCDGLTFTAGSACGYKCAYCFVKAAMCKCQHVRACGLPHEQIVVRRRDATKILRNQLTDRHGNPKFNDPSDTRVIYMSPLVDIAANPVLVAETVEACLIILGLTNWLLRLLSKSNLIIEVAKQIPERYRHRLIFGVSTGTVDDKLARSFEIGTPLVSKRVEALRWLQDEGFRTFAMICPSLPQRDYAQFAEDMAAAVRWERCEHVWAEVLNARGESFNRTFAALINAGYDWEATALKAVSTDKAAWEQYARDTFVAHASIYPPGKLRFLQYVKKSTREWWAARQEQGAILL